MISTMNLLDVRFRQDQLAYFGGVSPERTRKWIDTYHVLSTRLSERDKGFGGPRLYEFRDALTLATVRALVDDACLTLVTASKMVGQQGNILSSAILNGTDLHYSRRRGMILFFNYSGTTPTSDCGARALITIRPNQVWLEMRPRFMERYPAETAEFERKIAELHKLRAGGDE